MHRKVMNAQILKFYRVFQDHQFTEEEMQEVVEGIKAILRDEGRENATKKDVEDLGEKVGKDVEGLRKDIREVELSLTRQIHQSEEKQSDRFRYVYEKMSDYHRSTISWVVGTAIATGGLIVALIKLL